MVNHHLKQTSISIATLLIVGGALFAGFSADLPTLASPDEQSQNAKLRLPYIADRDETTDGQDQYNVKVAPFAGANISLPTGVESISFFVSAVIDGNSFIADGDKRVRLVGIKSPDKDEEYGVEATDFLKKMIEEKEIVFYPDKENPKDDFGRLRGVVYVENLNVNIEVLRAGLAHIFPSYPSSISYDDWQVYEEEAREAQRGLWGNAQYYNSFIEREEILPLL